jgi:hypothetical protein
LLGATAAAGLLAVAAVNASAAIVCARPVCWRTHETYYYRPMRALFTRTSRAGAKANGIRGASRKGAGGQWSGRPPNRQGQGGPPLEAALQSGFSMSGLQASRACMGARVVRRIRLPCERESVLPPSLSYPAFLRPDREECAAAGTLKTATDLCVRALLGADCFGACQHRDATIVAHGGRIFL